MILGNAFISNTADGFGGTISGQCGRIPDHQQQSVRRQPGLCHNGGLTFHSSSKTALHPQQPFSITASVMAARPFQAFVPWPAHWRHRQHHCCQPAVGNENIDLHLDSSGIKLIASNCETLLGTPALAAASFLHRAGVPQPSFPS